MKEEKDFHVDDMMFVVRKIEITVDIMRHFNFCSFYQKIMYTTRPVQQKVKRERKSREREKAGERREGRGKERGKIEEGK